MAARFPWLGCNYFIAIVVCSTCLHHTSIADDPLLPVVMQGELGTFNFDELENYLYSVRMSSVPVVASTSSKDQSDNMEKELLHDVKKIRT